MGRVSGENTGCLTRQSQTRRPAAACGREAPPIQEAEPSVRRAATGAPGMAPRSRAQRGFATLRGPEQDPPAYRHQGRRERKQRPHAAQLLLDLTVLSVTAVKIRGWRAAQQVGTGRSMRLCVPACCLPYSPFLGWTLPQPVGVRKQPDLRGIPSSRPLGVTDSSLHGFSPKNRPSRQATAAFHVATRGRAQGA